jgi:hypothetical protein
LFAAAKAKALEVFRRLAPVVGVGITTVDGGYGVRVNLREAPASSWMTAALSSRDQREVSLIALFG